MSNDSFPVVRTRGRPPRYLLSSIAVCGVCGAPTRIGTQNARSRPTSRDTQPTLYRVYECAGVPGRTGFHVSIRQEHLDEIVTDAVIARVVGKDFMTPRTRPEDEDGTERRALRLEIKSHRVWLDAVRSESAKRQHPEMIRAQEAIVLPKIEAATKRLEELEQLDPIVRGLKSTQSARGTWDRMPLAQQRHIVSTLMVPRINPVAPGEQGRRGPNYDRIDLIWRTHSE